MQQTTSGEGLVVRAAHHHNPYAYLLDGESLDRLLLDLGLQRAGNIWRNHTAGRRAPRGAYERACMAFVLMDPTVGPWVTNEQAILAAILVGDGAERFLPNAAAKAAGHRRIGRNYGEAVHVDPHQCGSGRFRYGHSAEVRGLIAGASSQTTDQDLFEARMLAHDFVHAIDHLHRRWELQAGPGEWLTDPDQPDAEQLALVNWFPSA